MKTQMSILSVDIPNTSMKHLNVRIGYSHDLDDYLLFNRPMLRIDPIE